MERRGKGRKGGEVRGGEEGRREEGRSGGGKGKGNQFPYRPTPDLYMFMYAHVAIISGVSSTSCLLI